MMRLFRAFKNAFNGLYGLFRSEPNFRIHVAAFALVIAAGFYFGVSTADWIVLLLTSALVLAVEGLNSAIEKLCDFITLERHAGIRKVKDFAAASVLVVSLVAAMVAILVFRKYC